MFDLRGDLAARQAKALTDEPVGEGDPICIRIRRQVGVELACRSTELGRILQGFQFRELHIQAVHKHSPLLAQRDRGCRLAVGPR